MRFTKKTSLKSSKRTSLTSFSGGPSPDQHLYEEPSTSEESLELSTYSAEDFMKLPIVVCEWHDAVCTGGSEWQSIEEIEEAIVSGPSMVRSVGILLHEADDYIAITDTLILDGCHGGYVHVIPKGMIRFMSGNLYERGLPYQQ